MKMTKLFHIAKNENDRAMKIAQEWVDQVKGKIKCPLLDLVSVIENVGKKWFSSISVNNTGTIFFFFSVL